ncbi:HHL157Cp [Eremothecium sinecaudum]|uniref:HHL157Cp n=1 Tax=Eremothecium sinecaudum TaxID=45286 RepID=A0A0X8HWC1_9SACH|nr:HHL157Cp [Eremothecium sinecaudum]AMD22613.1 HHL157Cp [Eremothecium sinecaudum]
MFNFGGGAPTDKPAAPGGGLFGQSNTNAGTTGGLFGNSNTSGGVNTGNLFGQNNNNVGGTGGLFGQDASRPGGNTEVKPGGLFGQNNVSQAGGLFGQNNNTNSTGGLFGNSSNAGSGTTGGLFGNNTTNTGTSNLFGNKTGGLGQGSGGLFGSSYATSNTGGLFGNQSKTAGFQQQQQNTQPMNSALMSISQLPITSMTRIADLPPQVRQEIEQLDQYFQRQVSISHHLKADEEEHMELIKSVPRDIQFLLKTYSITTQSLQQDLKRIQSIKSLTDDNIRDSESFSLILNQLLTPGTKVSSAELNRFFQEKIQLYNQKLDEYFRVLSDIKSAVNGLDNDMFGTKENTNGEFADPIKASINSIIVTVIEEFELFMDMAERVAQLHQRVKELNGTGKNSIISS